MYRQMVVFTASSLFLGTPVMALTEAEALEAVERFITAWNSESPEAFAATLHYPHVRPSAYGGERVYAAAAEYAATIDFEPVRATGWRRSAYDSKRVVHLGNAKAHVAGQYTRYREDGSKIWTNQVTYVVTEDENGDVGVQARFAAGLTGAESEQFNTAEEAALDTVNAYMAAFNDRDVEAFAATLNYPHVRLADGAVTVWESEQERVDTFDFDTFARRTGWDHSVWDSMDAIQVAANAVNVALVFSRYDADGRKLSTTDTLYLVTLQDGHWGIRARSSFSR